MSVSLTASLDPPTARLQVSFMNIMGHESVCLYSASCLSLVYRWRLSWLHDDDDGLDGDGPHDVPHEAPEHEG